MTYVYIVLGIGSHLEISIQAVSLGYGLQMLHISYMDFLHRFLSMVLTKCPADSKRRLLWLKLEHLLTCCAPAPQWARHLMDIL